MPPDIKETKLGNNDEDTSPSAGKDTGVVLVPFLHVEVCPYSYLVALIFLRSLGVICYNR